MHDITKIFPDCITGIYLTGSLATGDYNPTLSDIDLVVVLNSHWTEKQIATLKKWALNIIAKDALAQHLDIAFGEQKNVAEIDGIKQFPAIEFWKGDISISETTLAYNAIVWNNILQTGITFYGVDPHTIIRSISQTAISCTINSELKTLQLLISEIFDDDIKFRYYVIATCCRMMYTLETNSYISKKNAMIWYKDKNTRFSELITTAEDYAHGNETPIKQTKKEDYEQLLQKVFSMVKL